MHSSHPSLNEQTSITSYPRKASYTETKTEEREI